MMMKATAIANSTYLSFWWQRASMSSISFIYIYRRRCDGGVNSHFAWSIPFHDYAFFFLSCFHSCLIFHSLSLCLSLSSLYNRINRLTSSTPSQLHYIVVEYSADFIVPALISWPLLSRGLKIYTYRRKITIHICIVYRLGYIRGW